MAVSDRRAESLHAAFLLLHNTQGLLTRLEERVYFSQAGVSYQQYLILVNVASSDPPVTQTAIAERLQRNLNSISTMVDRMARQGLVTKSRSTEDRRETHVALTARGKEAMEKALKVGAKLRARLGAGFTDTELQAGMRLLTKTRDRVRAELGQETVSPQVDRATRQRIIDLSRRAAVKRAP